MENNITRTQAASKKVLALIPGTPEYLAAKEEFHAAYREMKWYEVSQYIKELGRGESEPGIPNYWGIL